MIALLIAFINAFRVTFGYQAIVKDYDYLFIMCILEFVIVLILLVASAMYHDFKD